MWYNRSLTYVMYDIFEIQQTAQYGGVLGVWSGPV